MCGRFVSTSSPQQLADYFSVDELAAEDVEAAQPNHNVAPTTRVMAVAERADARTLERYHWGLIPSWAKDTKIGNRMINARGETVAEKPAYRRAFAKRRCIIPADGFFEWKKVEGAKRKQPYFIRSKNGYPLAFAGLWEYWTDPNDESAEAVKSCTIITTDPNDLMAEIHDRMPVVLAPEAWDVWLDPENDDKDALSSLIVPAPSELFEAYPVTTRVNNPRNKGEELLEEDPEPVG